jgi:hypothetical protein
MSLVSSSFTTCTQRPTHCTGWQLQASQLAYLDVLRLLALAAACLFPLALLMRAPGRRAGT